MFLAVSSTSTFATPAKPAAPQFAGAPSIPDRITQPIKESERVVLVRNTRPEAMDPANDRGPLPDGYDLEHMLLVLQRSPEQEKELESFIESLNDRNSPNFHQWLTADQFGLQFGVSQGDLDTITGWLESHGFRINQIYAGHMMIDISGNAGQVRQAFGTQIHNLEVNGKAHIGNINDPSIPAALSPVLHGIFSLHDFMPQPTFEKRADYTFAGCSSSATYPTEPGTCYSVTPQDNAVIYNVNPLWSAGYTGAGQTIAVIEDGDIYKAADWTSYRTAFGLTSYPGTLTTVHPGSCTDPGDVVGVEGEVAIDAEVASGLAPGAAIELATCADTATTFGGLIAVENIVNGSSPYPGVMSISYGQCEVLTGSTGNLAFYNTYSQAATEGTSVFVSTGDDGPNSCSNIFSGSYNVTGLGITGWGETPYNVAVGGTDFQDYYNAKTGQNGGAALSTYWNTTSGTVATFTGGITSGSKTVTAPSGTFENCYVGATISGTGIPSSTTISSFASSTSATMSQSATATNSSDSITISSNDTISCGSAKKYVPEIPWNNSCGDVLIAEEAKSTFTTYGSSGFCNEAPGNTGYLSNGAASGGASNCATGTGTNNTVSAIPTCQGWSKPSFQTGAALSGGNAVYGTTTDGVRDIPDVSMFAANGDWGHYETICWSDTTYTSAGAAACTGAPSSWSGFGGTSVATPSMAGIQALVNQYTGETWGSGVLKNYYQIGQNEYGTAGGTFAGTTCNANASGGPGSSCAFNDVTQGDIDTACTYDGTSEEAHCYLPSGTYGVSSTDVITGAALISGGTGYTSAPTCTIAGPSNNNPYKTPTGTTLWAGGTQATCTATFNSGSQTNAWAIGVLTNPSGWTSGANSVIVGGTTYTFVTSLTAANQVLMYTASGTAATNENRTAQNLEAAINATSSQCYASPCFGTGTVANASATATLSAPTVTVTSKTAGYAGAFQVGYTANQALTEYYLSVWQVTPGSGPGYVSAITIGTAGSGYGPEAKVTLTGGGGSGAIAVANTTQGTAASSYQPTYGAAPGWDMATGLGTPNAANLVCNSVWGAGSGAPCTTTAVSSSANPSSYAQGVSWTATITPSAATGSVQFVVDGSNYGSAVNVSGGTATSTPLDSSLSVGNHTVTANFVGTGNYTSSSGTLSGGQTVNQASQTISWTTAPPASAAYGTSFTATATATSGLAVTIAGSGSCSGSGTSGSATITMTSATGTCTVTASQAGNTNYAAATSLTPTVNATKAATTIAVTNVNPASESYGQDAAVTITAQLSWSGSGSAPTAGDVTISGNGHGSYGTTSCSAPSGTTMTCTNTYNPTTADTPANYTESASFSGDGNYSSSSSSQTNNFTIGSATSSTSVSCSPNPASYGQSTTCTATINGQNGNVRGKVKQHVVTGTVTWSANTGCGTTSVTSGNPGTATCSTSSLAVGSDTVTGTYSGDSNHGGSSGSFSQTVNKATTTTAASSSLNPSTYGQSVNFTASVSGVSPTGTVQFNIDGNAFGSPVTLSGGSATSGNISTLTEGTHTVTAVYSGDSNNQTSTGTLSGGQVVNQATAATVVTSSGSPSTYGQPVTFTATINGAYNNVKGRVKNHTVTGTVAWSANTGCGTTAVTSGNPGTATCTTSSLPVGSSDTVTGTYSGDSNHSGSSGSFSQAVNQASTSIAVGVSPAAEDYGSTSPVTITAVLSWSGSGAPPTAANVTIGGNSTGTYGATSCGTPSGMTLTCTATLTPSGTDLPGSYTETASFSGDNSYSASNSPQTNNFTINLATSSTSVASSPNPSTYASPVTFTATINGENGAVRGRVGKNGVKQHAITGSVAWSSNTGCGTTSVTTNPDGSGTATCATSRASSLPVGTDTVTATYSGDSNHSGGTGSVSQVVQGGIATTIDVTNVSPASEDYGSTAPVTITAVLAWTGHGVAPTASDVTIGGNGTGTYGATSCAARVHETITCTATFTPAGTDLPGSYSETATFAGDSNYSSSSSPETNNFTVNEATSTTTVTSTPNPSIYAQSVTFTATIVGEFDAVRGSVRKNGVKQHAVTGSVAWSANTGCGTTSVTTNPDGSGTATCATSRASSLEVGTDTVTATYSGDSNHSGSTGSVSQVVQGGIATTIDVTNVTPAAEDFAADTPVTITAVLAWTGHGVAPTASDVTISGNGNGSYGATTCAARVHETITCTAAYTPTNADTPGSYTETASFSGDANYSASSSPETNNFTINLASSTTAVTSSGSPSTYQQSVTFTATINGENGFVRGKVKQHDITGTVAWSANTGCGTTAVTSGNPGTATCTTTSLPVGTDAITATYSGDGNHSGNTGTLGQTVNPASQTFTFTTRPPASAHYNDTFTVAASASSGLPVSYGSDGVVCTNSGALYTMISGTGTCTVTVSQAGNDDYLPASTSKSVTAKLASQTITVVTPAPAMAALGGSFTVVATAPSGTVTYGSFGGCTNSLGTYTMASSGKVTCHEAISATATSNYAAAPNVSESTLAIAAIAPTVSLTGPATANYLSSFNVTATTNAGVSATLTVSGPCTISGNSVTMTSGAGTCVTTANWPATDVYKAATATLHTAAQRITPTVTFTGAPSTAAYLSTFTVATTQNSGVTPTITSTTGTICTVSGNTVTMANGTGTCIVKASWATNDYYTATSLTQSVSATKLATTSTITSTVPQATHPLRVEVYFTVSNGANAVAGPVVVTASPGGESCTEYVTVGKCLLVFTAAGPQNLTAAYAGNNDNSASTSSPYGITVH
jgi:hypothetical protein